MYIPPSGEDSEAILLLDKLFLGKLKNKSLLIAGKCNSGKSLLKQSLTMFHSNDNSVNIAEVSPGKTSSTDLSKTPADCIVFCTRMDVPFGEEDKEVITCLMKAHGRDFLERTLFVLTMANQVHPFGTHRMKYSDLEYLRVMKEAIMSEVRDKLKNQKLHINPEQRFVLAGAPEISHRCRLIPDVHSSDNTSRIDWLVPVARALMDLS